MLSFSPAQSQTTQRHSRLNVNPVQPFLPDFALFAQSLTQAQRDRLRCWRNPKTHEYEVPAENCFYRVLTAVPVPELGRALVQWQQRRHGTHDGPVIALDGKTLKGSHSTHLVGALNLKSQRWLELERVPDKTNEIPAAQTLLPASFPPLDTWRLKTTGAAASAAPW